MRRRGGTQSGGLGLFLAPFGLPRRRTDDEVELAGESVAWTASNSNSSVASTTGGSGVLTPERFRLVTTVVGVATTGASEDSVLTRLARFAALVDNRLEMFSLLDHRLFMEVPDGSSNALSGFRGEGSRVCDWNPDRSIALCC